NYMNDYDVVLVLFTNRKCTGKINIETMPHLLLIYPENLEKYLSPTFAHRGLVDRPGENNY
ncbi:7120_t:CDS:1, partial [Acaulospora morrowiae]